MSRAKQQDVDVLALTDHDTTEGVARASIQAELEGIELIHGIEFSCDWVGRNIHVVGLNVELASQVLISEIASQHEKREKRAEVIAKKLASAGIDGALEGARQYSGQGVIGRPHFAQFLVDNGHCKTIAQCFKRYLGAGKPGDVKQVWPDIEQITQTIVSAGGVAVLAHPNKYKMTRTKLCALVADFKEVGGEAIEVVSGKQEINVTRDMAKIACKYELSASCGSDFHAPGGNWQELGLFSSLPEGVAPVWQLWEH